MTRWPEGVKEDTMEDDDAPYCVECGGDDLTYLEEYANGEEYKCAECGTVQIW